MSTTAMDAKIVERFSVSEARVDGARKTFEAARVTIANARAYGTPTHISAAVTAFTEAAEVYQAAMRTHAHVVADFTFETVVHGSGA